MPRKRRLWEPGDLLSIVGRGHEGRPLFATDDDRGFFVERLGRVFQPGDADLLGCEEPGCRGECDGCLLVHAGRRQCWPADDRSAPPPSAPRACGWIFRVHDERLDRQAPLRLAAWRAADLIAPVCARLGADPAAALAGRRRPAECAARALISHVVCDGAGISAEAVAELLGVSGTEVSHARVRGRALLVARGWTIDEVLSWTATGA